MEGEFEVAIGLANASNNRIEIAGTTTPAVGLAIVMISLLIERVRDAKAEGEPPID